MKFEKLKQDKGVAGLTILLSLVTMLFVIGLLVMIFALMGGELQGTSSVLASNSDTSSQSVNVSEVGVSLTVCAGSNNGVATITSVINSSGFTVPSNNYTVSNSCYINGTGVDAIYNGTDMKEVNYSYVYSGTAWDVMNGTTTSIVNVTDWFTIFIVIGAMVVLILLTVIIITAIKGSGMMGGTTRAGGNVGTA